MVATLSWYSISKKADYILVNMILNIHKDSKRSKTVQQQPDQSSSVARGGALAPPPHWHVEKMQNGKNTTFLALLRLFYALGWTQ